VKFACICHYKKRKFIELLYMTVGLKDLISVSWLLKRKILLYILNELAIH